MFGSVWIVALAGNQNHPLGGYGRGSPRRRLVACRPHLAPDGSHRSYCAGYGNVEDFGRVEFVDKWQSSSSPVLDIPQYLFHQTDCCEVILAGLRIGATQCEMAMSSPIVIAESREVPIGNVAGSACRHGVLCRWTGDRGRPCCLPSNASACASSSAANSRSHLEPTG
jgi:hypothetical protein